MWVRTRPSGLVLTHICSSELALDTCPNTSPVNVATHARVFASRDRHLLCVLKIHPSPPPRARTGRRSSGPPPRLGTGPQFPRTLAPPPASRVYPEPCERWYAAAAAGPPRSPENPTRPVVPVRCVTVAAPWRIPFSELCDTLPPPSAADTTRSVPGPKRHRSPARW